MIGGWIKSFWDAKKTGDDALNRCESTGMRVEEGAEDDKNQSVSVRSSSEGGVSSYFGALWVPKNLLWVLSSAVTQWWNYYIAFVGTVHTKKVLLYCRLNFKQDKNCCCNLCFIGDFMCFDSAEKSPVWILMCFCMFRVDCTFLFDLISAHSWPSWSLFVTSSHSSGTSESPSGILRHKIRKT